MDPFDARVSGPLVPADKKLWKMEITVDIKERAAGATSRDVEKRMCAGGGEMTRKSHFKGKIEEPQILWTKVGAILGKAQSLL